MSKKLSKKVRHTEPSVYKDSGILEVWKAALIANPSSDYPRYWSKIQMLQTISQPTLSKLQYVADPATKKRIGITCPLSAEQVEKLDLIATWDLSAVAKRASERGIVATNSLEIAENHYRVFLGLSYLYGDTPAFSGLGDDFWHTHLLFTRDYVQMCDAVFGRFLHHQPGFAETEEQNEAWKIMRDSRFKAIFGTDLWAYWNESEKYHLWSMNFDADVPFSTIEQMNCLFCD